MEMNGISQVFIKRLNREEGARREEGEKKEEEEEEEERKELTWNSFVSLVNWYYGVDKSSRRASKFQHSTRVSSTITISLEPLTRQL
ncbi:uncharacterized protein EAF02_010869 [Botrytis sinoallii]|uniref:uncharacterized protein n=1 Tax=Botrytis sinoallii TaxID=1463999 RepID=UPI0018FFB8B1|nr:uncharacterized protein EAF02_010869 [Botrytis sinoallii]KAF7859421.1 hypothetical protein EAF02_010869 [Botrytis sinoallii]